LRYGFELYIFSLSFIITRSAAAWLDLMTTAVERTDPFRLLNRKITKFSAVPFLKRTDIN
jgi:hypothetical protein